jgi:homocysteine S-methyltransferase
LLLDGATGTELDRKGVDCSVPLWSARAMDAAPEVLKKVHCDYLEAGAEVIITNTFRTHERSLAKAGIGHRAEELTKSATRIACEARD